MIKVVLVDDQAVVRTGFTVLLEQHDDITVVGQASGGREAIAVVAGGHGPEEIARFARWAKRLGIRASRGSDFHDPLESRFDVGQAPPLPPGLVPVWTDWPEVRALAHECV